MRSIEELREKTIALSSQFAADGDVTDYPTTGTDNDSCTSFQSGFPIAFATDPDSEHGDDIRRTEMNKFGELATAELHFKEAGMKHEFQPNLLNSIVGYPFQCLFGHFDGEYLKHIESQYQDNIANFSEDPLFIDNYRAVTTGGEKKVHWKTVDKIYGLDEDLFRLEVDYSKVEKLESGVSLTQDSLIVIGDYGYPVYYHEENDGNTVGEIPGPTIATLTLTVGSKTIVLQNKGRCGLSSTSKIILSDEAIPAEAIAGVLVPAPVLVPDLMCGFGNSTVVFYAKQGTTVSYSFSDGQTTTTPGPNIFAFPIILKVGKADGGNE